MVDHDAKKWQGLESKLSDGLPLWSACLELGIPLDDARQYLEGKREGREEPEVDEAVLSAAKARSVALEVLHEIIGADDEEMRLDAAKELLRHYREERKRLDKKAGDRPKKNSAVIQYGDWYFT